MPPTSRPDSFELGDYLGVLRRRWWVILVLIVVCAGAGAAYTVVAPKTYTSSVLIQVNALPNNANAVAGRTSGNVNMDNEAQIVQSVKVATLAAHQFSASLAPTDLVKKLSVAVPPNTTFLQVKCGWSTPSGAAACANAFGSAYLTSRRTTAASAINSELSGLSTRINTLATKVANLKAQLGRLPNGSAEHTKAQINLTATQQELAELQNASNKLVPFLDNLNLPDNTAVGQIATPAIPATSPSSPRALLLLPSGLLAGLLIGLLLAFFLDFRDRRIHSSRDVERFLDLPVLVDISGGRSRLQTTLAAPRSRAGQAFTELGQYVAASLGEGSHVIFVAGTSVGPACSVLAANLAATLARTRSEVVLICADPHGTVTPQVLGISDGRGLAEILSGSATAAEVARRPAGEKRLRVITPGIDAPGVLLHLQYEASRRLLSELRRDAHYVIVEVQSLGEDSDAFALAEFADVAIMAVETSLTTRPAAAECLQRLDRLRTSVLGAVVLPAPGGKAARTAPPRPAGPPLPAATERPGHGASGHGGSGHSSSSHGGSGRGVPGGSSRSRDGEHRPRESHREGHRPRTSDDVRPRTPEDVRPRTADDPSPRTADDPRPRSGDELRPRSGDDWRRQPVSSGSASPSGRASRSRPAPLPGGEAPRPAAPAGRTMGETRPMPRVSAAGPPEDQDEPASP